MRTSRIALVIVIALGAGIFLRWLDLSPQVLGDDEMHGVRSAIQLPVEAILVTYQDNDNCIPLSALFRWRMDRGQVLTEMDLRVVPLLCGVAMLLLPWLWRGSLPDRVLALWGVLLATSPLLVGYSRIVRSYMPMVVLAWLALTAAWRALHTTSRSRIGWWLVYLASAALAVWFHLGAAPFVASPLLVLAWDVVRTRRRPWVELLSLGLGLALLLALFLVPARESLLTLMEGKSGRQLPSLAGLFETLILQSGSRFLVGAFVFWVGALWGGRRLWHDARGVAVLLFVAAATQLIGLLAFAPLGIKHPIIVNRYLLLWTPLGLLAAAVAVFHLADRFLPPRLRPLAPGVFALGLLALGPWTDPAFRQSSFQHHYRFARFSRPRPAAPSDTVPAFYRDLAREGRGRPIYEFPWSYGWPVNHAVPAYQELHGRRVRVVYRDGLFMNPRLRWNNLQHFGNPTLLEGEERYLVLHKDLRDEELRVRFDGFQPTRNMVRQWNSHRNAARVVAAMLRQDWGGPYYEDDTLVVWDLDVVRRTNPDWQPFLTTAPGR